MTETSESSAESTRRITLFSKHGVGAVFLLAVITVIGSTLYSTISWMWDDQRLPLSKIVLQGDLTHVTAKDVQHAFANLEHIGTFMSQDINVLQQSVEQIPWVSQASVRKQWPDTVKVFLTEHQASAIWNGIDMLDTNGVVFSGDVSAIEEQKVKLYGPKGTELQVLQTYRDSNGQLAPLGLSISSLVLNERRAWQVILDNGIRLELGKDSMQERLERFISLYRKLGDQVSKISYIDLRYDTGAAVGWFPAEEAGTSHAESKKVG
ncbi:MULTISPECIES: cell division protein FtsQ/DivIB [Vibrio]|uniref:cell division protein FtsQ/DivIB n=1 Tax=Vibrio TaxID=662 RepID=UPI0004DD6578|nr:cell division protein FtsQ [Vibrio sp. ER1A]NOH28650.1 FtsQ-type POTRA domain-containing protein [Vibrio mediterranei]NOI22975.1 FtsQ-type POTRA domain-containing protein [Vibrio mediterranei]